MWVITLLMPLITWLIVCPLVKPELFAVNESRVLPGSRPAPGSPWPMPKSWQRDNSVLTFTPADLTLKSDLANCDLIDGAFKRLITRLETVSASSHNSSGGSSPLEIDLHVNDGLCPANPQLGDKEDYNIHITTKVLMQSSTAWGAIKGFETLGQLMYMVNGKWYINKTSIQDEPRFKHRGLHLDTARHFYPVRILKLNLDAMAANKFNVFHWHIVDTQAFPFKSTKFPQLSEKGAYSPSQTYSHQDIQEIIEYARLRGIRVLPEFDSPGHVYSWGKGIPDLLTSCWSNGKPDQAVPNVQADRENIDPSKDSTFTFLADFFQEIKDLFVDDFLHLGMDEATYRCWRSNPNVATFMKNAGLSDYVALEQYYDERLLSIIKGLNKNAIIWEDPINNGANISKTTLVQLWKESSLTNTGEFQPWETYMKAALSAGYHVILSSCWYLSHIHYGQDWRDLYKCDPYSIQATSEELSRIVGGEACTWSEYIDENNLLQVVWPRAAAVAERLWSPANVTNADEAALRLDQHRCRLVRQGIPASPILPGFCQDNYNTDNSRTTPHITDNGPVVG